MKVLFLTQTAADGPASRYRVYQYVPYLTGRGVTCTVSPGIAFGRYARVYVPGKGLLKKAFAAAGIFRRLGDISRARRYDVVMLQREIVPQMYPALELLLKRANPRFIFDFDDAIYLIPPLRPRSWLRYEHNIRDIITRSSRVTAGNGYLAAYARQWNERVTLLPTAVDTAEFFFRPPARPRGRKIVIGWIGTPHTVFYLRSLARVLQRLAAVYSFQVQVIGAANIVMPGVDIVSVPWDRKNEVMLVQRFDIGLAPLFDDEWGRGKCGLKALQYMACGVPVVCGRAGVYRELIQDNDNGFLAADEEEWVQKIEVLIQDEQLRRAFAQKARATVEERYSLSVNGPRLYEVLTGVAAGH